ncbi:MAG: hypothetical protein JW850_22140 [Thermoflexales bacterium]|nr:hypothetical protein [Thermoflexales bacterium]
MEAQRANPDGGSADQHLDAAGTNAHAPSAAHYHGYDDSNSQPADQHTFHHAIASSHGHHGASKRHTIPRVSNCHPHKPPTDSHTPSPIDRIDTPSRGAGRHLWQLGGDMRGDEHGPVTAYRLAGNAVDPATALARA